MTQSQISKGADRLGRGAVAAVLLTGAVALPASAGQAGDNTGSATVTGPCSRVCLTRQLRGDLRTYLKANGKGEHVSAAGLTVRLPRTGRTINVGAGTMRVGGTRRVTSRTVWQIGSNTKAFTSILLLKLEAEHKLSINDTLGKWLPRYKQWQGVTIKRLLNMTSGIPTYDASRAWLRAMGTHPNQYFTARQLVSYAFNGKPTHGYSYSNTNYVLGEMIIAKATHDTYRHQLMAQIIRPLHLRNLWYRANRYPLSVTRREPAGYWFNRQPPGIPQLFGRDVSRTTLSWARGAGAIIATTHAMTVWEQALYHAKLLPPQQQRELLSLVSTKTGKPIKHTTPADPGGFALGVAQMTTPKLGRVWFYEGETLGFRTLHVYLPKSGLIFALGLNSAPTVDHIGDLTLAVYNTLLAHGVIRPN